MNRTLKAEVLRNLAWWTREGTDLAQMLETTGEPDAVKVAGDLREGIAKFESLAAEVRNVTVEP